MSLLALLACSLPSGAPPAAPTAAPTVTPAGDPTPVAAPVAVAAVPVAGGGAAVEGAAAPPARIYVTLVSHNEEQPNPLCTPVVTDESAWRANRAAVVAMAKAVVEHKAAWDMQNEWEFLDRVQAWDKGSVQNDTNKQNLIHYVSHLDPARLEVDAHSHERGVSYADIWQQLTALGAPMNGIVGGFIYYPAETEVWTRMRQEVKGVKSPSARWKAELLWGAGTMRHAGPDVRASGIWRPASVDRFTEDDPTSNLPYMGSYQYGSEHDFTGVRELVSRLHKGELQAGHLYTSTIFFHQCDLTQSTIDAIMVDVDSLASEVAAGNVVWSPMARTLETWKTEYHSVPTHLEPLGEAPPGPGGPKGPGGGPRGGGPKGFGPGGMRPGGARPPGAPG